MDVKTFLHSDKHIPIWDVRSPSEYRQGHIPGAVNVPLFNDEERAIIGTIYKQVSRKEAIKTGLEIVGPKMRSLVERAEDTSSNNRLKVHCWRGGQRSSSLAWLLNTSGFEVDVLDGGYKSYRQFILEQFNSIDLPLMIIGGPTGSGKTEVLHALNEMGEQTVDLEDLANHRGSSFGGLGLEEQPTTEQFENDLFQVLASFDPDRPVWLENESRGIGKVFIPEEFWKKMQRSLVFEIRLATKVRIERLINEYAGYADVELSNAFERIKKRLGGLRLKQALAALEAGKYAEAARIALEYYDKSYKHHLQRSQQQIIFSFDLDDFNENELANRLIKKCYALSQ